MANDIRTGPRATTAARAGDGSRMMTPDDDDRRRRRAGWLWWVLLAIGLIALVAFLIARNANDAGDDDGVDVRDDPAAAGQVDQPGLGAQGDGDAGEAGADVPESPPSPDAGAEASDGVESAAPSVGAGSPGAAGSPGGAPSPIMVENQGLLPPPADLAPFDGKAAVATSVVVESVVSDEGFWVGSSPSERLFVRLSTVGESPVQVVAGQPVSFEATVVAVPADAPAQWGVEPAEGADQLVGQGYFLEVESSNLRQG